MGHAVILRKWTQLSRVQILEDTVYISHNSNNIEKVMNQIILSLAMGK